MVALLRHRYTLAAIAVLVVVVYLVAR